MVLLSDLCWIQFTLGTALVALSSIPRWNWQGIRKSNSEWRHSSINLALAILESIGAGFFIFHFLFYLALFCIHLF